MSAVRTSLLVCVLMSACTSPKPQPQQDSAPIVDIAIDAPHFVRCATETSKVTTKEIAIGGVTLHPEGSRLVPKPTGADAGPPLTLAQPFRLGVIRDTRDASTQSIARTKWAADTFRRRKVHAIVHLGGIAADSDDVAKIIDTLSGKIPLLVSAGDLVDARQLRQLIQARTDRAVVDLTSVHQIVLPGLRLLALPGLADRFHLQAERSGCGVDKREVDALLASASGSTTVLLAYQPPQDPRVGGVDQGALGISVGNSQLSQMMASKSVAFGIFGYSSASSGRASHGTQAAPSKTYLPQLWLSAASLSPVGQATVTGVTIVEFKGDRARFEVVPLPKSKRKR